MYMVYVRRIPLNVPAEQFNSGNFKNKILLLEGIQQLLANPFSLAGLMDYHFKSLKSKCFLQCRCQKKMRDSNTLHLTKWRECPKKRKDNQESKWTSNLLHTGLHELSSSERTKCWVTYKHMFKYCPWDTTYCIWTVLTSYKHSSRCFSFCGA